MAERDQMTHQATCMMNGVPTNINNLPDEMLLKIFSYLSAEDLGINVQFVCTHWSQLCLDDVLWKDLIFSIYENLSVDYLSSVFRKMPQLQCVKMLVYTPEIINELSKCCKNLRKLKAFPNSKWDHMPEEDLTEAFQELVTECTNLEELDIPGAVLVSEKLSACVGQLKRLRAITLTGEAAIERIKLRHFADGCPSLEHLDMHWFNWVYSDLKYFLDKKHNKLICLQIKHISKAGVHIYPLLSLCQNTLRELLLRSSNDFYDYVDEPASIIIKRLTNLTSLKILIGRGLTVDVVAAIFADGAMSQLLDFEMCFTNELSGIVIDSVCNNCPNILRLNLSFNIWDGDQTIFTSGSLNDGALENLYKCAKLEELVLSHCICLTDAVMDYIVRCTKLKRLELAWCNLTEKGLRHVLQLSELRDLDLSGCDVDGLPFHLFSLHLKKLRNLELYGCYGLDTVDIDLLHAEMPNLRLRV